MFYIPKMHLILKMLVLLFFYPTAYCDFLNLNFKGQSSYECLLSYAYFVLIKHSSINSVNQAEGNDMPGIAQDSKIEILIMYSPYTPGTTFTLILLKTTCF